MIAGSRNLVPALGVPRAACQPRQVDRKPQAARLDHACRQPPQDHQRAIPQAPRVRQALRARAQFRTPDRGSCQAPGVRGPDGSAP